MSFIEDLKQLSVNSEPAQIPEHLKAIEMPTLLEILTKQLTDKGMEESLAKDIATRSLRKSGNLQHDSTDPTLQGVLRAAMSPEERAITRASAKTGRKPEDFEYDADKNTAKLKPEVKLVKKTGFKENRFKNFKFGKF